MLSDPMIRRELSDLLSGGEAHMSFEQSIANFPLDQINIPYPNCTYTPWHLLEHVRFCQRDILDYIRDSTYVAPKFPDDYWLPAAAKTNIAGWHKTIADFQADLEAFRRLVRDPAVDLTAPMPNAPQHNIFRCILVLADHNSYHLGELAVLRQVLGWWGERVTGSNMYI